MRSYDLCTWYLVGRRLWTSTLSYLHWEYFFMLSSCSGSSFKSPTDPNYFPKCLSWCSWRLIMHMYRVLIPCMDRASRDTIYKITRKCYCKSEHCCLEMPLTDGTFQVQVLLQKMRGKLGFCDGQVGRYMFVPCIFAWHRSSLRIGRRLGSWSCSSLAFQVSFLLSCSDFTFAV
jgi:hypothetical protein